MSLTCEPTSEPLGPLGLIQSHQSRAPGGSPHAPPQRKKTGNPRSRLRSRWIGTDSEEAIRRQLFNAVQVTLVRGFFLCEQEQTGFELGFSQRNPGNDSQGRGDDAVRGSGRSDLQRIPGPAQDALPDEQLLGLIKNRTATENWSFSSNWQSLPTSERQPGDSGSENFEDPLQ